MNTPDLTFSQDETYEVQPNEIESVLQELWRETAGEDEEAAVTQVRTLNLLIFVSAQRLTPELLRAIDIVAVQHPGRIVTMLVTDDEQPPKAQVTIACRLGEGGKQVCGEQITIWSGEGGAPLPNIAASLMIAGVPTFLWWLGDPAFQSPIFHSFAESADRVILDSRTWNAPLTIVPALVSAIDRQDPSVAYTDLQWTALTPWRRLTSQCFDMRDARPQLDQLQQITIAHGPQASDRLAALLLVGWLGSRLGWAVEQHAEPILMRAADHTVTIQLEQQPTVGSIQRIELVSPAARFSLHCPSDSDCISTTIALPGTPPISRVARLKEQALEQIVSEELNMLEHDQGFEAALRIAAQLDSASAA